MVWRNGPNADEYDPHCRRCEVPLVEANARMSRGRFVGVCRPCESTEARERKGTFKSYYTDSRRKYPVPLSGQNKEAPDVRG